MTYEKTQMLLFLAASIALIITPGPDMVYVTTRGIALGRVAGIFSALGVCAGLFLHTTAATLGLAVLFKTSSSFFYLVKYFGVAYLFYLGIKSLLKSGDALIKISTKTEEKPIGHLFIQGLFTNVLNPKIALFFMSFLPQFVIFDYYVRELQIFVLGLVYLLLSLVVLIMVALLSDKIGSVIREKEYIGKRIHWFSGFVFIGLSISLAFSQKG